MHGTFSQTLLVMWGLYALYENPLAIHFILHVHQFWQSVTQYFNNCFMWSTRLGKMAWLPMLHLSKDLITIQKYMWFRHCSFINLSQTVWQSTWWRLIPKSISESHWCIDGHVLVKLTIMIMRCNCPFSFSRHVLLHSICLVQICVSQAETFWEATWMHTESWRNILCGMLRIKVYPIRRNLSQ